MELALSPEQEEIRKLVSEFAEREVKPRAEAIDQSGEFPRDLVQKAADLGLPGILVPEEYGGAGLDHISFATFVDEGPPFRVSTSVLLDAQNPVRPDPILLLGNEAPRRTRAC